MSTSKHIDKICIAVMVLTLLLTIFFMNASKFGVIQSDNSMGYEDRIFNTDIVHSIDIVMNNWDDFIENCENEEYSSCTVLIDGEKISNVGLRAKGNTSLSSVKSMDSQRYSFKIEFDQYEEGKSYYGLDKLCLNNIIQDNTMMKDYLVYTMMAEYGVTSPLCSYVYITVNGQDWGLYLAVEGVEDSFLNRNYGSDTGEMYKPDSMSFGAGKGNGKGFDMQEFMDENSDDNSDEESTESSEENSGDNTKDSEDNSDQKTSSGGRPDMPNKSQMPEGFNPGEGFDGQNMPNMPEDFNPGEGFDGQNMPNMPEGFNPGEGFDGQNMPNMPGGMFGMGSDDVKLKYIDDDIDSYTNIFDNAKTDLSTSDKERLIASLKSLSEYQNLDEILDIEEVLRYFVVHNFVVNGDSYTGMMVHNYYLHEKDGQLSMIPWDYNLAFGTFQGGDASSSVNASIDGLTSGSNVDDRPMFGWIFSSEEYTNSYHELYASFVEEWIDSGKLTQLISDTKDLISPYVEKDPTKFCTMEEFEKGVETISEFISLRGEAVTRQLGGDDTLVDTGELETSDMGSMNNGGDGKGFGNQNRPNRGEEQFTKDLNSQNGDRNFGNQKETDDK